MHVSHAFQFISIVARYADRRVKTSWSRTQPTKKKRRKKTKQETHRRERNRTKRRKKSEKNKTKKSTKNSTRNKTNNQFPKRPPAHHTHQNQRDHPAPGSAQGSHRPIPFTDSRASRTRATNVGRSLQSWVSAKLGPARSRSIQGVPSWRMYPEGNTRVPHVVTLVIPG